MSDLVVETRKMVIGIREPKEVEIFPLSFADQKKFATKIADILAAFSQEKVEELSVIDMAEKIILLIEDNIKEISGMVIQGGVDLDKVTNEQIVDLCTHVYEMNYDGSIKKVKALVQRLAEVWTKTR
jgi:hypothetical protein